MCLAALLREEHKRAISQGLPVRIVYLNDVLLDMLKRRVTNDKCSYVFHIDSKTFTYREVQHNYTVALKSAGLYPKFSGTHFMRHSMATITRSATQSLELTQSITGHKDQRLVQHCQNGF